MTSSHHLGPADAVLGSRRMGRRLLSGSGSATLSAFRIDPDDDLLVLHALDAKGRILVAACPSTNRPLGQLPAGMAAEVRLDVTLDAAEPGMHLTAASAHLLGVLTWWEDHSQSVLDDASSATCHCAITGPDPLEGLAELARARGGRLGVIRAERVVVHDAVGVHAHAMADVLHPADTECSPLWSARDELTAQEAVKALGQGVLTALCTGVLQRTVPGWVCSTRSLDGACRDLADRVLCVDVSPETATLMQLAGDEAMTVQVRPPRAARTAHEMAICLGRLVQDSVAVRPPRI